MGRPPAIGGRSPRPPRRSQRPERLTGYVAPILNTKLFVAGVPLADTERDKMLRTWYRLNAVRMVALGAGWLALQRVRR